MMSPFEETEEETQEENLYIPREYGINFETGQLSGKMVEGYDALLVWAWLALRTPRYRYYFPIPPPCPSITTISIFPTDI